MQICIFEDSNYINLEPLIYPRPVYELICGISSLKEKILRNFPKQKYSLHCRAYLGQKLKQEYPKVQVNKILDSSVSPAKRDSDIPSVEDDECLFINGRILAGRNLSKLFSTKGDRVFLSGNTLAAVKLSGERLKNIKYKMPDTFSIENFEGIPVAETKVTLINYIWDLINNNGAEIKNDFDYLVSAKKSLKKKTKKKIHGGVHFVNRKDVIIAEGVEIKPGCVLDASKGPIYIDKNVLIYPNAVIEGPAYIGEKTKIKTGAAIYENVSIGKVCKVGGEVEDIIMMPYSNKQHAGFIGHSYIGSWVNLGADTNNSDLKNNYGNVKVQINGNEVDSGSQFLGLVMGDHSKSGINTMFNTGTVVGFSCNVFGAGFPSKEIPSFSWGGKENITAYEVEKSIQTARRVFKRRDIEMSDEDESLFKKIFEITKQARAKKGY